LSTPPYRNPESPFGATIALCRHRAEQATSNKTGAYNREQDIQAGKVGKETGKRQETREKDHAAEKESSQDNVLTLGSSG